VSRIAVELSEGPTINEWSTTYRNAPAPFAERERPQYWKFHHLSPDKEYDISEMVSKGYSWPRILRELKKCQILCANDHRRITARQRKWYRAQ
jgi:hypothetical protein